MRHVDACCDYDENALSVDDRVYQVIHRYRGNNGIRPVRRYWLQWLTAQPAVQWMSSCRSALCGRWPTRPTRWRRTTSRDSRGSACQHTTPSVDQEHQLRDIVVTGKYRSRRYASPRMALRRLEYRARNCSDRFTEKR